jgi:transcriptional activator SPT8
VAGSQNSSEEENDMDEAMDDVDDADADGEGDVDDLEDGEGDNDEEEGENEDEEEQDEVDSPTNLRLTARPTARRSTSPRPLPNGAATEPPDSTLPDVSFTSPSPRPSPGMNIVLPYRPSIRPEALTAITYDIVPTIAAPQSTSINAVTATPDMRWVFSGGTDGYIRKFHWPDSANGKVPLTVAQRHPFVDSVVKAGVLSSYWENEDTSGMRSHYSFQSVDLTLDFHAVLLQSQLA